MKRLTKTLLTLAACFIGSGCGGPGAGTDTGQGSCLYVLPPDPDGIQGHPTLPNACSTPSVAPDGQPVAFCGATPRCGGPAAGLIGRSTRALDFTPLDAEGNRPPCICNTGEDFGPLWLDPAAQKAALLVRNPKELFSMCRTIRCQGERENCISWLAEPRRCFQLGFLNGYLTAPIDGFGGNNHDGDLDPRVCPIPGLLTDSMGTQGVLGGVDVRKKLDLRAAPTIGGVDGFQGLQTEVQWCKWYGGALTVEPDGPSAFNTEGRPCVGPGACGTAPPPLTTAHPESVHFATFRPDRAQRISMVGDWIVDEGHTEIHDVRFVATVKSDRRDVGGQTITCDDSAATGCLLPNTWHVLTSGFFAAETAQQDRLSMAVPIPAATDSSLKKLEVSIPELSEGGCWSSGASVNVACDQSSESCTIVVNRNGAALPARVCESENCPCSNALLLEGSPELKDACAPKGLFDYSNLRDQCKPQRGTEIAFARDVRVDWVDPMDLWSCNCECDDPSVTGAVIRARVQGCVLPGPEERDDEERREACEQACGGVMCGAAPNCRIGSCRVQDVGPPAAALVALAACSPTPPFVPTPRVARAGDYRVELTPGVSTILVGDVAPDLTLIEKGHSSVRGSIWFNQAASGILEIADMKLSALDFKINGGFLGLTDISVNRATMFMMNRMPATMKEDGTTFTVAKSQVKLGARALINGEWGGSEFVNEHQFTGSVNQSSRRFVLDGSGRDAEGHGLSFHLEGEIVNRPPRADPGPDRVVECETPTTTAVTLDGRASFDGDPGDVITHYQWFKGAAGVSNQPIVTVGAPLGDNHYRLHVYDHDLGSDSRELNVRLVDTTPPALSLNRTEWCLWPPNHNFALFKLGEEITYSATDRCDPHAPLVQIVALTSDEAVDAAGSGATSPDVRFRLGGTAACLRSERAGTGPGRGYTATIQAVDSQGNAVRQQIHITVPHDLSGHPQCIRAQGIDEADERCDQ